MKLAVLLTAFIAVFTFQTDAIRVQFAPGTSATKIKGNLSTTKVRYVLRARAQQQMKVALWAPGGDSRLFVYGPNSDESLNGRGMNFDWSRVLTATGDYLIQITRDPGDQPVPFELEISLTAAPAPAATNDEFSVDGYYVWNDNRAPKGFAAFKGFNLTTFEPTKDGKYVAVPPYGEVDAPGKLKLINIKVTNLALSFETRSVRGTSYKFDGKFLISKGSCDDKRTDGPVLGGHLIRLVNGAKAAEADVKFGWACGDD